MSAAARLIIEALRLDRWDSSEVTKRVDHALELGVGGFILFGGDAEAVSRLTADARAAADRDLWIGADLERGAGQQFRGLTELPPPAALARASRPAEAAGRAGAITGREARSVGVDWVLAPVVDLDVEPRNPIVGTRGFGADPDRVAELAARWVAGCQSTGALACAKHFPGHGRTVSDSHVELPRVEASGPELERDLLPFAGLAPRVATVMVGHVAYPALGCDGPATRSPEVVRRLLRDRLGFRGPVATDAMIRAGVGDDEAVAAVEAVRAGCDLVLYPGDARATTAALERAAEADPAFADRLREAVETAARGLAGDTRTGGPPAPGPDDFDAVAFAVGTIVDRTAGLGAWDATSATEVVAVSDDPDDGEPAGRAGPLGAPLREALDDAGWNVVAGPGSRRDGGPAVQTIVVLAATPRGWKGHAGVSDEASRRARRALGRATRGLLVLLGHARHLDELGLPGIAAWSTETVMERAAAAWIVSRAGGATG